MNHPGTIARLLRAALGAALVLVVWSGTALAATGTTSVVAGPRNTTPVVTHTHAGNFQTWQIERRAATLTAGSCSGYSAWSAVSPVNPPSPWIDAAAPTGRCYQYRQSIEDISYNITYWAAPGTVQFDTAAPTGALNAISPYIRGSVSLGGTASDLHTGLSSITARLDGTAAATVCSQFVSPWTCMLDTTLYPDGPYTVLADVVDGAGNLGTVSRSTAIDNMPPVLTVDGFTELTGSQYMHAVGSTMYVNATASGSFSLGASLTDTVSGADHVDFPSLGSGWMPAGGRDATFPYAYTYTFAPGAADPGMRSMTSTDTIGNPGSSSFTVTLDSAGPIGGSGSTDIGGTVTFTNPTDALSGLDAIHLERRTAPLSGGVCGMYAAWSPLGGADPTSPYVDATLPAETCAQYRLVASDHVGNVSFVSIAGVAGGGSGDTTAPSGTISASSLLTGTVTISGEATDADSGVAQVDVSATGPGGTSHICTRTAPLAGDSWTCQFNTSLLADGVYTLQAVISDLASNDFTVSRMALIDTLPPTASLDAVVENTSPAAQHFAGGTVWINSATSSGSFTARVAASDLGSGVAGVTFPALGPGFSPGSSSVLIPSAGLAELTYTWAMGAVAPGLQHVVVEDNAGRTTSVDLRVSTDGTAPTPGAISATATASGARVTFASGTDDRSGIDTTTLERRSAPIDGSGNCTLFGVWTPVGGATPSSPYDDAAAASTSCHEYRMIQTDYVGNQRATAMLEPLAPGKLIVDSSALRAVTEGGDGPSYVDIVLNSRPSSPVTIDIVTNDQVLSDRASVTFGTGSTNWSMPQRVTFTAVNDLVDESDPHAGGATFTVSTADARFTAIAPVHIDIDVLDNDTSRVTATPNVVELAEGGADATVTVRLATQPSATVTVLANPDAQTSVAGSTLTFTPMSWNTPQAFDITAVDDVAVEGAHSGAVTFTATSADPSYDALVIGALTANITDNDLASDLDPDAPVGGSVRYAGGYSRSSTVPVEFTVGTDAGSGVASWRLQRRTGRYGADQCLLYGAWSDIGAAMPSSPYVDSVATHTCTQYRLAVRDTAGNVAYWADPAATVMADRTTPTGSIDDPAGSTVRFDGSAIDIGSGAVTVSVRLDGPASRPLCTDMVISETLWSCPFDVASVEPGPYTIVATVLDAAGNTSILRRTWTRADTSVKPRVEPTDREAPTFETVTMPQLSWGSAVRLTWGVSDNARTAPTSHVETRSIGTQGAWSAWQIVASNVRSGYAVPLAGPGTSTCARVVAVDAQGNTTRSGAKCASVPLDERALAPKGPWSRLKSARAFSRTVMVPRRGAPTLATVLGGWDKLQLVAGTCPTCGTVEVLVGGKVAAKVSLRRAKQADRVTIPIRVRANAKGATVTLRVVARSGRTPIDGLFVIRTR